MTFVYRSGNIFPGRIVGSVGIDVVTTNGIANVQLDPTQFPVSADPTDENNTLLIIDDVTGDISRATAQSVLGPLVDLAQQYAGDAATAAGAPGALTFVSRAVAEAADVAPVLENISVIHLGRKLDYVEDTAEGTALVTNDGRKWSPAGVVTPFHWGAINDFNSGTQSGTNNTAAFVAMRDWCEATLRTDIEIDEGDYLIAEPIVWNAFYVNMKARGLVRIWGNHTQGPIFHFRKSYFDIEGVRAEATDTRRAATFNILNSGFITGDFDYQNPAVGYGTSGAFGRIEQCTSQYQPGDGILHLGGGGKIDQNVCQFNKGAGIRVDTGTLLGLTSANLGYPGWSTIIGNRCSDNGGEAIVLGNLLPTSSDIIYRYRVENNDCGRNSTDAAVRFSTHQYFLVAEQLITELNVASCDDDGPGMFVAGSQHKHIANRFVNLNGEAYEIGDLAGYATSDIEINSFRVNDPFASLDPAIKIAATITASRDVRVHQGNSGNITKLVADADRDKYAEITYRQETSFSKLYENDVRVGPLDEGSFVPTVGFSTPGDQSITYSAQDGYYKRLGANLAFVQFAVTFSPTYTTASGTFLITLPSLPFSMNDDATERSGLTLVAANRVVYDTGQRDMICRVNTASTVRIAFTNSADVEEAGAPVNFPSGVSNIGLVFSGIVRTD